MSDEVGGRSAEPTENDRRHSGLERSAGALELFLFLAASTVRACYWTYLIMFAYMYIIVHNIYILYYIHTYHL